VSVKAKAAKAGKTKADNAAKAAKKAAKAQAVRRLMLQVKFKCLSTFCRLLSVLASAAPVLRTQRVLMWVVLGCST
jgi:hypothetical protein